MVEKELTKRAARRLAIIRHAEELLLEVEQGVLERRRIDRVVGHEGRNAPGGELQLKRRDIRHAG